MTTIMSGGGGRRRGARRIGGAIGALLAVAAASPAAAKPPMYAHKAGVSQEALNADEVTCFTDAQQAMRDPKFRPAYIVNPATQSTAAGAMGSAFAYGLAAGIESGKRFNTTLYDCFIGHGYTMRRISVEDWKAIKALPKEQRAPHMLPWRMAPEPVHPVVTRDDID